MATGIELGILVTHLNGHSVINVFFILEQASYVLWLYNFNSHSSTTFVITSKLPQAQHRNVENLRFVFLT